MVGPVGCGKSFVVGAVLPCVLEDARVLVNPFGGTEFSTDKELIAAAIDGAVFRYRGRTVVVVDDWCSFSMAVQHACTRLAHRSTDRVSIVVVTNEFRDLPEFARSGTVLRMYPPSERQTRAILADLGLRPHPEDPFTGDVRQSIRRARDGWTFGDTDRVHNSLDLVNKVVGPHRGGTITGFAGDSWAYDTVVLNLPNVVSKIEDVSRCYEMLDGIRDDGRDLACRVVRNIPQKKAALQWRAVSMQPRACMPDKIPHDVLLKCPTLLRTSCDARLHAEEVIHQKITALPSSRRHKAYKTLGLQPRKGLF
ncbi:MAG: hypothetical protein CL902_00505 [Dehalococcoidia bacterium]|nr:hypothetical protein [Dehalococcoidia bacterium]